jgi:hypothetical protein
MTDEGERAMITIANDGQKIVDTNYWQLEHAARGLFFLSINAGCVRLLVPKPQEHLILDMTKGVREVVLTRGQFHGQDNAVEVMFEDGSDSPFCIHLDEKQQDRLWTPSDEAKKCRFAIYTENGQVALFTECYLRRTTSGLPYMRPRGK